MLPRIATLIHQVIQFVTQLDSLRGHHVQLFGFTRIQHQNKGQKLAELQNGTLVQILKKNNLVQGGPQQTNIAMGNPPFEDVSPIKT